MKKLLLLVFTLTLISYHSLKPQIKVTISSDSTEYSYGQPILLKIEILNNSDSIFMYYTCWGGVYKFDDFDIGKYIVCADDTPFPLLPCRSVTWKWKIDPSIQGIPNKDGVHKIVGYYGSSSFITDTILISAPAYYGGAIVVAYLKNLENSVNEIKDSLNATVINRNEFSDEIDEVWQIRGCFIDSVISKYRSDRRFKFVERFVIVSPESITTFVENNLTIEFNKKFLISEAYPNPFNSSTNFYIEAKSEQNILIELFNSLGQKVKTIFNGKISANRKNYFTINLNGCSSGIYMVSARNNHYTLTRKIFFMK